MIHHPKHKDGAVLPVVEEFYSIQGEGYHMGKPAYFIRIGGCDIACSWCDTKYSWDPDIHPAKDVSQVIDNLLKSGSCTAVVTGGEPLMYNLDHLCEQLKRYNIQTFLETSGAYPLSGNWDWICLSPKQQHPPRKEIYKLANELKVVIAEPSDLKWAEENSQLVEKSCHLFLQPEWKSFNRILPLIVDFVKLHTGWRISLQSHKFMHLP